MTAADPLDLVRSSGLSLWMEFILAILSKTLRCFYYSFLIISCTKISSFLLSNNVVYDDYGDYDNNNNNVDYNSNNDDNNNNNKINYNNDNDDDDNNDNNNNNNNNNLRDINDYYDVNDNTDNDNNSIRMIHTNDKMMIAITDRNSL